MKLLRVLLLLTLWNGPLPWLDHHGDVSQDAPELAEHLKRFHTRGGRLVVPTSGWHIHWVLPPCPDEDAPVPVDEPLGDRPAAPHAVPIGAATAAETSQSSLSAHFAAAQPANPQPLVCDSTWRAVPGCRLRDPAPLFSDGSVLTRLCVLQC